MQTLRLALWCFYHHLSWRVFSWHVVQNRGTAKRVRHGSSPSTGSNTTWAQRRWKLEEGDTYSAAAPMPLGHENQVFAGGKMLFEARWPNAGKPVPKGLLEFETATMGKGTTRTKIVDNALVYVDDPGLQLVE